MKWSFYSLVAFICFFTTNLYAQFGWVSISYAPNVVPRGALVTISWTQASIRTDPVRIEISYDKKATWQRIAVGDYQQLGFCTWTTPDYYQPATILRVSDLTGDTLYSMPFDIGISDKVGVRVSLSDHPVEFAYPNPVHDVLTIPVAVADIQIFDEMGHAVIAPIRVDDRQLRIDCSSLSSGDYQFRIKTSSGYQTARFEVVR